MVGTLTCRAMRGFFCRQRYEPQLDQQRFLDLETWHQLGPAARVVLGATADSWR